MRKDADSTSQSRYFLAFVPWLWFLQDKGFDESTEKARAGWQCPSLKFEGRESFKLRPALRENLVLPLRPGRLLMRASFWSWLWRDGKAPMRISRTR